MQIFGTWKRTVAYLWIVLIFSAVGTYLYFRGAYDGIRNYKHSIHMQMALEAAYKYGYWDCKDGHKRDWNNGGEEKEHVMCTNCTETPLCISAPTKSVHPLAVIVFAMLGRLPPTGYTTTDGKECK
jgi:hypothetical protein